VTEPGAEAELLATALEKLTALRLVTVDRPDVCSRPAIARFALDQPTIRPSRPTETRKATADAARAFF
jgi:hypothetical protein